MAQTRRYDAEWIGVWKGSNYDYVGAGTPIRVGGSSWYYSYLGFPEEVRQDMTKSNTTPKVRLILNVTNPGEFDVGIHKMSYNYARDGLPQIFYVGLHPYMGSGEQVLDITNFVSPKNTSLDTMMQALNEGFQGVCLYSDGGNYGQAYGKSRDKYRVQIEVEGTWNTPPSKPTVTYPNGGESLTGKVTLTANPATDAEQPQSQLRYRWGVYDGSWHYYWTGSPGETDITLNFTEFNETNRARVAVRAFDSAESYSSGLYGEWDYSDAVFTIRHNTPPEAPTELTPSGGHAIDRTNVTELTWRHNDVGNQSQYEIRWRLRGNTTWNYDGKMTTETRHFISSNVLPAGTIEWQVRTYDDFGLNAPWSNTALFESADPADRPELVSPANGDYVTETHPTIEWTSVDQHSYEIRIWNGNQVVYETSKISENRATTLNDFSFENDQIYQIQVRIENSAGLLSEWGFADVMTSFTPPPDPIISLDRNDNAGSITVVIDNPDPSGTEPAIKYNAVYRRLEGSDDEWILLYEGIPRNGAYADFRIASGVLYEYKVTAYGDNGTDADSIPESESILIKDTIISIANDPGEYVFLKWNPDKSFKPSVEAGSKKFQNRLYNLVEFGPGEDLGMSLSFTIREKSDLDEFLSLMQERKTLMYRDSKGRKEFIAITEVDVKETESGNFEVSFSPIRVYYKEDERT